MPVGIPLQRVPSQQLNASLAGQPCQIAVYQKRTGVYLGLVCNGVTIVTGAICQDRGVIVRRPYRPFLGDLIFIDTQGQSDPDYSQFSNRFVLAYYTADELG